MSANPTKVQQYGCYQLSAPDGKWVLTLWQKKKHPWSTTMHIILSVLEKPSKRIALIVQRIDFFFIIFFQNYVLLRCSYVMLTSKNHGANFQWIPFN